LKSNCIGSGADPVANTFKQVFDGADVNYVIWNDQFYQDPQPKVDPPCVWDGKVSNSCSAPWGHSKGVLAWGADGSGLVMQVTTPDWPGNGNSSMPRSTQGNTMGCVHDDNAEVSQHFFGLKLSASDTEAVLHALQTASVVTDPSNPQLVQITNSPSGLAELARGLGQVRTSSAPFTATLSAKGSNGNVKLIAKPHNINAPPWQMVSAELQVPLRVASWWSFPEIDSQHAGTPGCWDASLAASKTVEIAVSGHWASKTFGLKGGLGTDYNHAKLGVSTDSSTFSIMGDMNQQGSFNPEDRACNSSQNGRGGLFFVIDDTQLHTDLSGLLSGSSAPYPDSPTPSPSPGPSPPSPTPSPPPPSPSPAGSCCRYSASASSCSAGQICCSSSGKSYTTSASCARYGAKHHCHWTGYRCVVESAFHNV